MKHGGIGMRVRSILSALVLIGITIQPVMACNSNHEKDESSYDTEQSSPVVNVKQELEDNTEEKVSLFLCPNGNCGCTGPDC